MRAYSYPHGFGIVHTKFNLTKDFHFVLEKGHVHPIKFMFNTGDAINHKLEKDKDFININFSEVIIVSSIQSNNHHFIIPAHIDTDIVSLEINRKLFEEKILLFMDDMDIELSSLLRDVNGVTIFSYKGGYSYDIGIMLEEFKNCQLTGMSRYLYLEAKAYEIFVSFIEQYKDDTRRPDKRNIFRQNQIRFVKMAAEHIKENLENLANVQGLAQEFGLNTNILQNGFRSIYGMSVNEFVQNERLLLAKKLLEESDYSISEITYLIGLNSKSYLSKIFLERYAMTPSAFRSNVNRENDGTN